MQSPRKLRRAKRQPGSSVHVPLIGLALPLIYAAQMSGVYAASYTWSGNTPGTSDWNNAANWTGAIDSGTGSNTDTLTFFGDITTALANGNNLITTNVPATLTLNVLTLNGKGAAATAATNITIGANTSTLTFDGISPTVNLNGMNGSQALNYTIAPNLVLSSSTVFTGAGSAGFTFTGNISGASDFTKAGSSSITLSGTNTYGGVTTINGGTVNFTKASALYGGTSASWTAANISVGSGATAIFNVGGTGEFTTGNVSTLLTNLLAVNNNGLKAGASIGFNTASTITIADKITNSVGTGGGNIALSKRGSGTLTLSGNNSFTGGFYNGNAGTLILKNSNSAGTGGIDFSFSTLKLDNTGTGQNILLANSQSTNGCTFVNVAGDNKALGSFNLNSGSSHSYLVADADTLELAGGYGAGTTTRTAHFGGAACFGLFSGNITFGNNNVEKYGVGTWQFTGANSYSGATTVTAGTLLARSASALGASPVSVVANANLSYVAASDTTLNLVSNLVITGGASTVIGSSIGSTGTSAEIKVTGTASATGAVKVNVFGLAGITPLTGTNAYTLVHSATNTSTLNSATYSLGTVYNNTNFTVGAITKSATDLQVDIASQTALTTAFWKGGLTGGTNVWAASNGSTQSNWTAISGGANQALIPGVGADVTISNSPVTTAPTSTYLGADMSIKSLTIADTTNGLGLKADFFTLTISPTDSTTGITVNSSVPASTINSWVKLGTAQTWTNNSSNALTVSNIVSGTGSLTKAGSGPLVLGGLNTFSGDTSLNQGTITLSNQFAAQGTTVILNGGALVLDQSVINNAFTLGGLAASSSGGSNDLALQNSAGTAIALTVGGNNASTTYAGVLSGSGSLTKAGTGTLIVTATNTFTGSNTLTGGLLSISSDANLGASNTPITFNGGGLQVTGTTVSSFGSHPLAYNASKTVTLDINDANNNFNAGTTSLLSTNVLTKLGAGTLTLGAASNALTTLNINANSIVDLGSGNLTINNTGNATITTTAGGTINATGGGALILAQGSSTNGPDVGTAAGTTLTINAKITGPNAFEVYQSSGGTVVLNGTNDYTGDTYINGGTLQVSNIGNHGSTTSNLGQGFNILIGSGQSFKYTGQGEISDRIINLNATTGTETVEQSGSGLLKFTSNIATTGNGARTLALTGSTSGTGEISGVIPNSASGAVSVSKSGTGTWTLSGSNTYTGATTVSAGTLKNGSVNTFTSKGTLVLSGTSTFDLNGYAASFTDVTSSVATGTITDNSATSGTSTFALSAQATTNSALIKDGQTQKVAVSIINNNSSTTPLTLSSANTFSGGMFLLTSATGTRLRISSAPATTGSAGAIVSSPFGTGPIVLGQAATDKAGIVLDTVNNITIANDIVFNTALGTDIVGLRLDTTGNVLSGKIIANLANATFAIGPISTGGVSLTGQVTGSQGLALSASTAKILTVTLNNNTGLANDYAGDTTVGYAGNIGNVLVLGRADQIPNGAGKGNVSVIGTLNLNGYNETINGLTGSGTVDGISGSPTLTIGDADATGNTFSGVLKNTAGALALTKIGAGMQTLSGSNTYTGATTLAAGTLNLSNQFAAQNSTVTMNGGALVFDQSVSGNAFTVGGLAASSSGAGYDIAFQNNAGTPAAVALTVGGNNANTTYAGVLSGSGSLTKVGTGTLTLTGTNTYSGGTSVNAGTLSIGSTDALPGWNTADRWTVNSGATLAVSNSVSDTDISTLLQTGTNFRAGSALGFDTTAGDRSYTVPIADLAVGSLGLTKVGSNTLALTVPNTYTGLTTLSAGTVNLGVAEIVNTSGPLGNSAAVNPGSIVLNGGILQCSALNSNDYSGRFSTAANQAYNVDTNGQNVTWATVLSSSGGSVTKLGAGTLTLSGSNTYTGTTTIGGGVLVGDNAAALGNGGNVTFTGGTLQFTAAGAVMDLSSRIKNSTSAITLDTNGQYVLLANSISNTNTGGLTKLGGGTLELKSAAFTGPVTLLEGALLSRTNPLGGMILGGSTSVLVIMATGATQTGPISIAPNSAGVTINNYSNYSPIFNGAISIPESTSLYIQNNNSQSGSPNTNMQVNGVVSGSGSLSVSGGGYAGAVTLAGTNTHSGGTTILGAGYIRIGVDSVGSVGSIVSSALGTGTVTLNGSDLVSSGSMERTILNPVSVTGNVSLGDSVAATGPFNGKLTFLAGIDLGSAVRSLTINSPVEFDGSIGGIGGGLTKAGGSTLTLTGSNTYTGATTVSAGTLLLGDGTAGHDASLATSAIANNALLVFNYYDDQTFNIPFTGNGGVWQQGEKTLTLTGSNSAGTISILSGTLQFGNGTAGNDGSLSAVSIINNSSLVYNSAVSMSGTYPISGTGSVTKSGDGALTLSGSNSFSGGLTLNSGTLIIGKATALGSGTFTIAGPSTVQSNGTIVTTNAVAANADLTIGGTSALTLGAVTFGANRIVTNNNTVATTTLGSIANNSNSLAFNGDGNTSVGAITADTLNKSGAGALTLTGSNAVPGGVNLNSGTLVIGNATALGSGTLTIAGASTVQSNGTIVTTNPVAANADFSIGGSAALTLGNVSLTSNRIITNNNTAATTTFGSIAGGTNNLTFSGNGSEVAGVITAALLTKAGAGTLTVSASPSVTALVIKEGTLSTNNSLSNVGSITLGDSTGVSTVPATLHASAGYASNRTINVVGTNQTNTIRDFGSSQTYTGAINLFSASVILNDATYGTPGFNGGISGTGNVTFACTHANNAGGNISVSTGGINISGTIFNASTIGSPINLNSVISGPTVVTQNPTSVGSMMTLSGSNTFTGGVILTSGSLRINHASALGLGTFTINGGTIDNSSASAITNSNSNAINVGADFTFAGTNALNLGAGNVTLNGAPGNRAIAVNGSTLTVGGAIADGTATGLTKVGVGVLVLAGSNSYSGGTTVNGGTLQVGNVNALGTGALQINNGTLDLKDSSLNIGALSGSAGALITNSLSGTNTLTTAISSGTSTYAGNIANGSGAVALTQSGPGTLTLSGSNTYSGGTSLGNGTLQIGSANSLGTGGLTVNGGTLDLHGNSVSVSALSGLGGAITSSISGTSTLSTSVASGTASFAGNITNGTGGVALTKQGAGKLILSGSLNMAALNAEEGGVELAQSGSIGAVTVSGSGSITLTAHTGGGAYKVLDTSSLSITSGGSIDLWNNAMVLRASGTAENASNLTTVKAAVNAASNGLQWNGTGLGSTTAFNEAGLGKTQALALMVYDNTVITQSGFEGVSGLGYFDAGTPIGFNQVLVKLTYLGDFNADGVINASDYTWLDGYALGGNTLGDLNGDGAVNATDYTWLDGSALNQNFGVLAAHQAGGSGSAQPSGASVAAMPSAAVASSPEAVPEPGVLGMLLAAGAGLNALRRRANRGPRGF